MDKNKSMSYLEECENRYARYRKLWLDTGQQAYLILCNDEQREISRIKNQKV